LPGAVKKVLSYVEPIVDEGSTFYEAACRLKLEGIVSKRLDSPYRAGRSGVWLKTKRALSDTFVALGFSEDKRDRIDGLYLARREGDKLVYAGKAEHAASAETISDNLRRGYDPWSLSARRWSSQAR
jgi:bifunctional non-homologous end joining protein LigD